MCSMILYALCGNLTNFIEEASQNKWLDDETIKKILNNKMLISEISSLCQNYDIDINLLTKGH